MREESQRIIVGRISGIYGVQGWLKIVSYTRPKDNILTYNPWLINLDDDWLERVLLDGKTQGKVLIAKVEGVVDRDDARALLHADIAIYRAQLVDAAPGEYYWHDLLGLSVINKQGEVLGKVTELFETGANDVLVVENQQRYLIPFVKDIYILDIDQKQRVISVDWATSES